MRYLQILQIHQAPFLSLRFPPRGERERLRARPTGVEITDLMIWFNTKQLGVDMQTSWVDETIRDQTSKILQ